MIKSLEIENIQSHKKTFLEFHPGVNCIIGTSDTGKSSIQRALNWIITNRPVGNINSSSWIRKDNDKDKLIGDMVASITTDDAFVARLKNKDENLYKVGTEEFAAVKTDVPPAVSEKLNLSEVNIQSQYDNHFMLSSSPGEVARFFNKIIKLDVIDRTFVNTENRLKKTKAALKVNENTSEETKEALSKLDWLDKAESCLEKVKARTEALQADIVMKDLLKNLIVNYEKHLSSIEKYNFIEKARKQTEKIETLSKETLIDKKARTGLVSLINKVQELEEIINKIPDLNNTEGPIEKIETLSDKIKETKALKSTLLTLIQNHKSVESNIKSKKIVIKNLQDQLPDTCPLCGNLLKEGSCDEKEMDL